MMTPIVLQFINTSGDIKDYYYLQLIKCPSLQPNYYQLKHYVPDDDGVYVAECFTNEHGQYVDKVIEKPQHETTDLRFLEDSIAKSHSKVHVFLGPTIHIPGKHSRFHFHHDHEIRCPTNEQNKFVGVFLYAHNDNCSNTTTQKLILFKKNSHSLMSYENIGEFSDLDNSSSLAYSYIEKFTDKNNRIDIFYYGERIPEDVPIKIKHLLRTMPLSLQVMNQETCIDHETYERFCISCIQADILSAPRQLTQSTRTNYNRKSKNVIHRYRRN